MNKINRNTSGVF